MLPVSPEKNWEQLKVLAVNCFFVRKETLDDNLEKVPSVQ
jgi:hypothetical protein